MGKGILYLFDEDAKEVAATKNLKYYGVLVFS